MQSKNKKPLHPAAQLRADVAVADMERLVEDLGLIGLSLREAALLTGLGDLDDAALRTAYERGRREGALTLCRAQFFQAQIKPEKFAKLITDRQAPKSFEEAVAQRLRDLSG